MPITPAYPGVYVQEIPSGVRTITGVATSITAFVGRTQRGPVNEPVTINSYADFERVFGGLWVESALSYAVQDFYLNGGSQAIIVRLFNPAVAEDDANGLLEAQTAANAEATLAANAVVAAATGAAGESESTAQGVAQAAAKEAKRAGVDGPAARTAAEAVAQAAADAVTEEPTPKAVADAATDAVNDAASENTKQAAAEAVAQAAQAAADAATKEPTPQAVADAATAAVPDAIEKAKNAVTPVTKAQLSVSGLSLEAANPGTWGNALEVELDNDVMVDNGEVKETFFNLAVTDTATGAVEKFGKVAVSIDPPHPRAVNEVLKNQSKLLRVIPESDLPTSAPEPTDPDNKPRLLSGSDGQVLTSANFTDSGQKQGLRALDKADLFNLLCLPPYEVGGNIDTALVEAAAAYCEDRRAMLIIDPPNDWNDKDQAKTGISTISTSKSAALFFPRLRKPNPLRGNQIEDFAPCGAVAGVFARTDSERGVWKAPAGLEATLNGVPQLSVPLTDAENGELNPLGINCLRSMPAAGRVVWGARTRQGDDRLASEWKYVPVRRLALYIEESLYRGTQWVVFEPNDEPLWAQIRLNLGTFMHDLFRKGAFQGTSPKEAYFVKCDKETTTQSDINLGIVNIVVGFAPLKPAEFVIISLQQMAGQTQT